VGGVAIPPPVTIGPLCSKRLLALASDEALVEQIRRGNEAASSVAFERHAAGLLGFCRHMVGSPEDAEDAVQHTFAAAFRDLARPRERQVALKLWLYAIARNRCLSMLRSRREHVALDFDLPTEGLSEQVQRRAELRDLLRDMLELPEEQRAALLLSEAGDLSHAEVAEVLGCEVANVKALVFRARGGLIQRREARETHCTDVREQLANLRGSSLRRSGLRHHLRSCAACRAYHEQVDHQRRMLAAALPVVPSLSLRSSVLGVAGLGGGSAGGGIVTSIGAGLSASLGTGTLVQLAAVGVLLVGGVASWEARVEDSDGLPVSPPRGVAQAATPSWLGSGAPGGAKPRTSSGVQPGDPRVVDPRAAPGAVEQQGPAGAAPTPARPESHRSVGQDKNANRAPLAEDDAPTGFGRGRDSPVAEPESDRRRPAATPPAGAPLQGGRRADTPLRGGRPHMAPDRRGASSSTPDRRGAPSSPPVAHPPAHAAPVQHDPAAPKPPAEPRANVTAPKSPPVAAPQPEPVSQQPPAPGPPEKGKGPGQ
jgi:RNA polymerase sigma factor (sigma-70 family)